LTGETELWFELAFRLKQPVQFVQAWTTSTEFVMWMEYLEREHSAFHREDYYLAQIAAEIRMANARCRSPKRIKLKDFLLRFKTRRKKRQVVPLDPEKRMKRSKNFWLSALGIKRK